ncbi:MAG: tetratricopeptide repeat protein [Candidatus Cloacimonetes bacterium]|nr:tetratricopeptide repeat protein [Candidatus Cloacimonadota bacterium]
MKKTLIFSTFLVLFTCALHAISEVDSLKIALLDAQVDERIIILNTLATKYWYINPDSSINFAESALELARARDNKEQEATAYHKLGGAYYFLSDYSHALENYKKSLLIRKELRDDPGVANISNNIGMIYQELGSYDKALDNYMIALQYYEAFIDEEKIAVMLNNIGTVYGDLKNYDKALLSYMHSLEIKQKLDDKSGIASTLHNIGRAYDNLGEPQKALEYYERSVILKKELNKQYSLALTLNNIGKVYSEQKNFEKALTYFGQALQIEEELGDKFGEANTRNNIGEVYLNVDELSKAENYLQHALKIAQEIDAKYIIEASYLHLSKLYDKKGEINLALDYHQKMFKINQEIFSEQVRDKIAVLQARYETEKKDQEIDLLVKERDINELTIEKQQNLRNFLIVLIFLVIIIAIIMYISYRQKRRDNLIIAHEKTKSDNLLMNIFPLRIANDLKETGKTEPELFKNVTVYFSDIVGFTVTSARLTPQKLIDELNEIFTAFDEIIEKYECERIKTIGDAYLAVGGMNRSTSSPAINIVRAALANLEYLKNRNKTSNIKWQIRIGIHTGDVIGGVVGIKKYIYDVFGDTINIASRMEQYSDALKINISEDTYHHIKQNFTCIERDGIIVKGKGVMKMYYVEGVI